MKDMASNSVVGIARVKRVEDKAEIKLALFDILGQVRQRANIQLPSKAKVMIKVNLCLVKGYETGTSVDPFIARCLVEWLLQEFAPEVIYIGEADATELNADIAFKALGWNAEFEGMPGVELVNLARDECVNVKLEKGLFFRELAMSRKYMESDFLISLAKLKTNQMVGITCILKNQFGITPVKYKAQYHSHLNEVIHDLNLLKLPDLCLVDGIIAMEGEGPVDGIPKPVGLLIAGNDPVATDHACARIMQIPARSVPPLKRAIKKGLGRTEYEVVGEQIRDVKTKFIAPSTLSKLVVTLYRLFVRLARLVWHPVRNPQKAPSHNVKVGIVGLGAVSELCHLPVLSSLDCVEIVAACEKDSARRQRRKTEWHIPVIYEDYEEMYNKADLDAVFICLPAMLHYEAVKSALGHNLHVFCEKPLGLSSERAYELVTIARKRNLIFTVGYSRMLSDGYQKAAKIVKSLRLGKILQVHGVLTIAGPYAGWIPRSDWFFDEKGGGVLYDSGSHLFSILVCVLSDKITEICATGANTYRLPGVHDQISGYFRTEKGVLGTFNIGWRAATTSDSIEIIGSGGSLLVASDRVEERHGSSGYIERVKNHFAAAFELISGQLSSLTRREGIDKTFLMEDEGFIKAVIDGQKAIVTGEEALHVLAVLGAVKESIETGDKVGVKSYP